MEQKHKMRNKLRNYFAKKKKTSTKLIALVRPTKALTRTRNNTVCNNNSKI